MQWVAKTRDRVALRSADRRDAGAGACHAPPQAAGPARHGRYSEIGIFSPGPLWAALEQAGVPADAKGATIADDDAIIVVVDGLTGEVRECGNLSGVCVKLDPWSKAIATSASAPLTLSKHAGPAKDGPTPTLNKADSEVMRWISDYRDRPTVFSRILKV